MKAIVFGATGAIGLGLVELLSKKHLDWEIVAVSRNGETKVFAQYENVKLMKGDANSKEETVALCADKDLIFATVGFPKYEAAYWAKHWPLMIDNLLAASSQNTSQKFVFCDNLYAYVPGRDISPASDTIEPSLTSKRGVRALIRTKFQDRMNERPESIVVVGASDFFGPGITNLSILGDTFTKAIVSGKSRPLMIGSSSKIHAFCYSKDFSKALYIAGMDSRANGKFWICPHSIKSKTTQDIAYDIAEFASSQKKKILVIPGFLVRMAGVFDSMMKEMVEMLPIWQNDYSVDDSQFCNVFDVQPTGYEVALRDYVDFYRSVIASE